MKRWRAAWAAAALVALVTTATAGNVLRGAGERPTAVRVAATPAAAAAAAPAVTTRWLHVVDIHRWTVSHHHVLAHARTLRTLLLLPSSTGPHPLVVFCHGYDITPVPYLHMLRHWAAAGFVVAAPYFPLTQAGAGRWLDENDVANQPRDVSVVITATLRALGHVVDSGRIIVAGHSDGGSTAFAVGFQRRQADSRVEAVMTFAGDRWGTAAEFVAPARRLPLLLVQSDHDEFNPVHAATVLWHIAHRPKAYLHLHGARHLPPFTSSNRWRPIVEAVTTDFLRAWTARTAAARTHYLNAVDRDGARTGLASVTDDR